MLKKILLILIFLVSTIFAKDSSELFEILANNVNTKEDVVVATGDVVVYSSTYYITAEKIIYDKKQNTFELFNDVTILKNNSLLSKSDYAFLDINKDELVQNPVLFMDSKTNLWMSSNGADKKNEEISLASTILSSCDCIDPDWSIRFSSGDYDTKAQWVNTYNTRFYFKDVPVFYTPYFGLPTDTTRHSGLLFPTLGYSSNEGFQYSQPIYLALDPSYDLEITPEIRTNRGHGVYTQFRLADSANSFLTFKAGVFEEKTSYYNKNNLENKKHFGYNLDYKRNKLFSKGDHKDEMLLSINWLNDVDYKSLEEGSGFTYTESKIKSFFNYYYTTPEYYLGSYFKFYLDVKNDSNDETLQELPQFQLHSYTKSIFLDRLNYSADMKYTNFTRVDGITADKYDFTLPISYGFSMFDDYLNIVFKDEIKVIKLNYFDATSNFDNGTFVQNKFSAEVSTDLLKSYENNIHTLNLSTEISIPETMKEDGDLYSINSTNSELESFSVSEDKKTITFALSQSIYTKEELKEIINHKLSQSVIYDSYDNPKFAELENEITINYLLGSLGNRLVYSNLDSQLIEASSYFSLNYLNYFLRLNHYMSKDTPNSFKEDKETYYAKAGFTFYDNYTLSYYENYNLEDSIRNKQGISLGINDKCWRVDVSFIKEIKPTSSTTSTREEQNIVYINLTLKPFGTFKVQ